MQCLDIIYIYIIEDKQRGNTMNTQERETEIETYLDSRKKLNAEFVNAMSDLENMYNFDCLSNSTKIRLLDEINNLLVNFQ